MSASLRMDPDVSPADIHAGAEGRRRFALAFDKALFLAELAEAHPEFASAPPADPVALYLSSPVLARLNANALFDEPWYRRAHPDVEAAVASGVLVSGLHHYVAFGLEEGRFPTYALQARAALLPEPAPAPDPGGFDAEAYLLVHPEARLHLRHFPTWTR